MIVAYIQKGKITPFLCKSLFPLLESPFIFGSRAEHFFIKKIPSFHHGVTLISKIFLNSFRKIVKVPL